MEWGLRFSQQCSWRFNSFGLYCSVVGQVVSRILMRSFKTQWNVGNAKSCIIQDLLKIINFISQLIENKEGVTCNRILFPPSVRVVIRHNFQSHTSKSFIVCSYSDMFQLVIEPPSGLRVDIKQKILTAKIRILLCTNRV